MESNADSVALMKQRELLPDIIAHQDRVREKRMTLSNLIKKFEAEWEVDTTKSKLEEGKPEDPTIISTVDGIYSGMQKIEGRYDELITRMQTLVGSYLGEPR